MVDWKPSGKPTWTVDASTVGRTIAEGRCALGLTQEEVARRLGVTKAAVSKWEQAASLPDIGLLPGIASLLDLTVDELLGWDPQLSEEETVALIQELRAGFARDAAGTFTHARRIAASHWRCWQALTSIASELLRAASMPAGDRIMRDEASGDASDSAPLSDDLVRDMLNECIAICEHVERDSGDAAMANLAVSAHAAAMIRRKDDSQAIIDFVEPFMQPAQPLGGKPGLANLYLLAGDRDRAGQLVRSSMTGAIAELNQATLMWLSEKPKPGQIAACADAFAAIASAYGAVADAPQLAVLIPTTHLSAATALVEQNELDMAFEQLERAADGLEALDAESLAESLSLAESPAIIARTICELETWGAVANQARYQQLVTRIREAFVL